MTEKLSERVERLEGPDQYVRKADVLAAFQQENEDGQ